MSPFAAWENFYVIVGSSAAALTGLQFVVIVLGAERSQQAALGETTRAFGTPTVVHFCMVLLVSAILSAPWPALLGAVVALGACGVGGVVYVVLVISHTRRQTQYKPVLEDWLWHSVFPMAAYAALLVAAATLRLEATASLFAVATACLVLLFSGIHNAWDAVIFIAATDPDHSDARLK